MLPGLPTSSDRSADIAVVVEPQREIVEVRTDDERAVYVVEPVVASTAIVPTVLADLTDVDETAPADGQVLTFDSTVARWGPATPAPIAHTHPTSDVTGLDAALTGLDGRLDTLEARPIVDSPDDIGAAPAGDYATNTALTTGLAGKSDTGHTHPISGVTGLQAALDGKQATGDYATNTALTNGLAGKANTVHTHSISNVTGLQTALDGKAAVAHTHAVADTTGLQAALDAKAPLASPTFTGTVTAPRFVTPPVVLADAATIATDAALGNHFRVTLAGNRTLGAPTNPTDGQKALWELVQDATGNRTLALDTGAAGFAFGTDITSITLSTAAGKRDFLGAVYSAALNRWLVLAFAKGF
ncbi:hypothetical protein [Actinophytocola sp.]|uniref:hypothetical protein n=1 Tax=Actinophytocola sp. TaxID=1872138 RepID=UPI002D800D5C|nr:hypothetical protein [Actinophytocola sp.]HET9144162.1 hypothetical protein [Actinophytocola sp.]